MTNVKDKFHDNFKGFTPQHKIREGDKQNKGKGIQCHEYGGFGHIQVECSNFLKDQKKGYIATLSDEESKDDSDGEKANIVIAFTICVISKPNIYDDGDSSDEDLPDEDFVEAYKLLYIKRKEECMTG